MTFNSIAFVVFFLVVTPTYFVLPKQHRWILLILASCYFYMVWNRYLIAIIFLTVTIDYVMALYMEQAPTPRARKVALIVSLISNLGILGVFKYSSFFVVTLNQALALGLPVPNLILPIGISFHTFQAISYTIDVYRGTLAVERHYGRYLLYVLFYPQLVAGPIERASHFLPQLQSLPDYDEQRVIRGLQQMLWGFFKKVVVGDALAEYVNIVYAHPQGYAGFPLLLGTWFFAVQIYCDFSGYTDIAIGAAKVMGFDLARNFNRPYVATSLADFWHRWHISLSTWFRDYLYKPLGGSRCGLGRQLRNVMIVFVLSGLWHGANWTYIVWGAIHGMYLIGERLLKPERFAIPDWVRRVITFNLVSLAWIFFRASNLQDAWFVLTHLGFAQHTAPLTGDVVNLLVLLVMVLVWVESRLGDDRSVDVYLQTMSRPFRWAWAACAIAGILLQAPEQASAFIYFQF